MSEGPTSWRFPCFLVRPLRASCRSGLDADDARLDAPAVQRFAGEFYQPARALLIAAGDVNEPDVARAFAKAASKARGLPKLDQARRCRFVPVYTCKLGISPGFLRPRRPFRRCRSRPRISNPTALPAGDRTDHERAGSAPAAPAHAGRRPPAEAAAAGCLRPASAGLGNRSRESTTPGRVSRESHAPARGGLGRSRNPASLVRRWPLGIGVTLRRDSLPASDPTRSCKTSRKEAEAAVAAGEQNSRGETRGAIEPQSASVTAANGTHIEVRRRDGGCLDVRSGSLCGRQRTRFADTSWPQRAAGNADE